MKWSENAWNTVRPVYEKIVKLPFIQELTHGTLDSKTFAFYIQQDAIYLSHYGKTLTGIASKLHHPHHVETFIRFASGSVAVEKVLHKSYVKELSKQSLNEASPTCLLYTSYLWSRLAHAPIEVAVAAVLPCFRIYKEVGDFIIEKQTKENNPYQRWIDTYGGEAFATSVNEAEAICNELAESGTETLRNTMMEAYLMCSKLEWKFWDSAYKQETWEI